MYYHIMDVHFLISSEINEGEPGNRLIHLITSQGHPVVAFTKDFENVEALQRRFQTTVIFIVLDINKNPNQLAKVLSFIPEPNYVISFPGVQFLAGILGEKYRVREREPTELSFDRICKESDEENCRILVNVVPERSTLKKTSGIAVQAFRNLRKKVNETGIGGRSDNDDNPETEPLLSQDNSDNIQSEGFLATLLRLLSFCFPCLFPRAGESEREYVFENVQQLRDAMRSEHIAELNQSFRELHSNFHSTWSSTLARLEEKEAGKIEVLLAEVETQKEKEERQLSTSKQQWDQNRRQTLTGVLSSDTLNRAEASISRQNRRKLDYDANKRIQDGKQRISVDIATETAQLRERHFRDVVNGELKKMNELSIKYQKKFKTLHERHFGRASTA